MLHSNRKLELGTVRLRKNVYGCEKHQSLVKWNVAVVYEHMEALQERKRNKKYYLTHIWLQVLKGVYPPMKFGKKLRI